jgi:hypothetical protein
LPVAPQLWWQWQWFRSIYFKSNKQAALKMDEANGQSKKREENEEETKWGQKDGDWHR